MTEKIINSMKKYSKANFIIILLAIVSLLVVLPAPEAAAITISVDAESLDNTIIIEFTQETTDGTEIQKINVWVSKDNSFTSFNASIYTLINYFISREINKFDTYFINGFNKDKH